ncbi:MAG TPA: hypothetical protein VFV61_08885, partial [Pyrinomonadaceae bacterium]|nr:hypothetical protein [Pyrinomonadaceae bacterium]
MRFTASSLRGRAGRAGILILTLLVFAGASALSIPGISHAARARVAALVSLGNPTPVAPTSNTKKLSLTTRDLIYDPVG